MLLLSKHKLTMINSKIITRLYKRKERCLREQPSTQQSKNDAACKEDTCICTVLSIQEFVLLVVPAVSLLNAAKVTVRILKAWLKLKTNGKLRPVWVPGPPPDGS